MKKLFALALVAALSVVMSASSAMAAIDLLTFTVDVTPVETMVPIILTALSVMFSVRKIIKTINRS